MTASTSVSQIATAEEVLARVRDLVPMLRANALRAEQERQVPQENIDALAEAGVFRLTLPKERGGFEASAAIINEVAAEIARGCPSTSWVATLTACVNWLVPLFPDEAQDEVFATPDVRVVNVLALTGKGARVDGGWVVNGRWPFNTGSPSAHWSIYGVLAEGEDGTPTPYQLLVPIEDVEFEDDWFVSGLAGTGSRTAVLRDVFVPEHRALAMASVGAGEYPGSTVAATHPYWQRPALTLLAAQAGTAVGIARGALDAFLERLPGRGITYTDYTDQSQAPLTHHQVGNARLTLDSAEAHMQRAARIFDKHVETGTTLLERGAIRAHMGYATKYAREAVDILFQASGASAIQLRVPIQRYQRDIEALSLHALSQTTTSTELYGRMLLGLPPNSMSL